MGSDFKTSLALRDQARLRLEAGAAGSDRQTRPQRSIYNAVLDGANLAGPFLYDAQFLNCARLIVTRNWQSAFRDETLACGVALPERNPE